MQSFLDQNSRAFGSTSMARDIISLFSCKNGASFISIQSWVSFMSGDMTDWNSSPIDRSHRPFLFPHRFRSKILATLKSYRVLTFVFIEWTCLWNFFTELKFQNVYKFTSQDQTWPHHILVEPYMPLFGPLPRTPVRFLCFNHFVNIRNLSLKFYRPEINHYMALKFN